jgi:hypothetical protein
MTRKENGSGVKRVAYTTNLDPELIKKLKIYCAVTGKYQNEVLEELIAELVNKEGGNSGNTN